ncbi:BrnT family toxin [Candidatus Binatia bacterium]|nr:BrnT family toxin [Candidatus Binatia bacterium]
MRRLVADEETAAWLARRPPFVWDQGNSLKSTTKHGVTCDEAESLIERVFVLAGRVVSPVYAEPRWVLFGETDTGKRLTMVFTRRGAKVRVISCRPMGRKERKFYESLIGREEETGGGGKANRRSEEYPQ